MSGSPVSLRMSKMEPALGRRKLQPIGPVLAAFDGESVVFDEVVDGDAPLMLGIGRAAGAEAWPRSTATRRLRGFGGHGAHAYARTRRGRDRQVRFSRPRGWA